MYVAAKGGEAAIQASEALFSALKGKPTRELVTAIQDTLPYLVDRVMGEASLYAPELASLAIAQSGGDLYEAVLLLRAYRSTQPRLAYAVPVAPESLLTVRRISAAFKDIPGGQVLGPSLDYSHRILNTEILDSEPHPVPERASHREAPTDDSGDQAHPPTPSPDGDGAVAASASYPLVAEWQRRAGLLAATPEHAPREPADIPDVTRDPALFPAPREHRLQALARADTGGVLALGYASMRGYGLIHPTVNELRLAHAEIEVKHPVTGVTFSAGRARVSQAEVVTTGDKTGLSLGFAATLGWNEVKLIAAATLDIEMNQSEPHPAHTEEFVMYHTEPVEASGFCIHFKLPHYVTFASSLDNLRKVISTFYSSDQDNETSADRAELEPITQRTP
ncbi:MAG: carbon-phosphorus lyase complex subunit PhnI [Chloroflexota bacterium]|nr:carbon-phosphorus lyase complex subunit PhnI [Chloroflexota bacterium]